MQLMHSEVYAESLLFLGGGGYAIEKMLEKC